jgi:hypothetical protein
MDFGDLTMVPTWVLVNPRLHESALVWMLYKSATFSTTCKKYELMNIIQLLLQSKNKKKSKKSDKVTKSFARTKGDFTKVPMSYK